MKRNGKHNTHTVKRCLMGEKHIFLLRYFDCMAIGLINSVICCISRYNLMFSLTGGGKYNFLGTKKWIEENLDHAGKSLNLYPSHKAESQRLLYIFLVHCSSATLDQCVKHLSGKLHLQKPPHSQALARVNQRAPPYRRQN